MQKIPDTELTISDEVVYGHLDSRDKTQNHLHSTATTAALSSVASNANGALLHNSTAHASSSNNTNVVNSANNFVKIGGQLTDASDPRTFKRGTGDSTAHSMRTTSGTMSAASNGNGASSHDAQRLFFLRVMDSRKWHYSEAFALFLDFFAQVLTISFCTDDADFHTQVAAKCSRLFSSLLMICYFIDMTIRVLGLRSALLRSHSNVADLLCLLVMVILLVSRFVMGPKEFSIDRFGRFIPIEYNITLGYLSAAALRLILKPRARTFSKKLHKFRAHGDTIRISIESLKSSLTRIPGVSAMAIEMMETDLVIICGRDEGDMTRDELMRFLEKALFYRPSHLSATEFLGYLRDIDAQSSKLAYGSLDVVRSTLWHWSNQSTDLTFTFFVVCINAAVNPALSYFLSQLSSSFENMGSSSSDEQLKMGIFGVLGICVPFVLGNYSIGYFQSKMISKATEKMQSSLLDIILRQGTYFFAERSEGDLNNLFSSDIARVNALWQAVFWNLFNPLVSVVFGFAYALYLDYAIGIMAFAFSSVLLSSGPQGFAAQRSKEFASKNAYVAAEFQNAIACQKVVRAYAIQEPLLQRFRRTVSLLRKNQFSKDFWSSIVQIYIESAMFIFVAIMTASLAIKVHNKGISPGDFMGFTMLLSRVSGPITVLGGFMRVAIGNASSLQRIDDIIVGLGRDGSEDEGDSDLPALPKMQRDLSVDKLVFKYDKTSENYILNELSATIPRGAYTCIVGPSGCGKSTFLACLMQFQEADGGSIRLDGHDIFNFSKKSFMDQTAVVFQDGGILNGTIFDNIRYGNVHATDEDCIEAARLAECSFITDLKDGFNTVVGQHATCNLSGGQAQRICLARALCRRPSLLLLDEATSALDPETEASIIATLERLSGKMNMTIISVTHRLSTSMNADLILVLNQGRVAECGRYETLVNQGGLFYEMVHKTESGDDDKQQANQPHITKQHSQAPGFGARKHVVSRSSLLQDDAPLDVTESALALQQFTKKLSSRVVDDPSSMSGGSRGTNWSRYTSRNSRSRRPSNGDERSSFERGSWFANEGGRRSNGTMNTNRQTRGGGAGGDGGDDERSSKYFVL